MKPVRRRRPPRSRAHLLERTSAPEIKATQKRLQAILDWHRRFHFELESQRQAIERDLEESLSRASKPFAFEHWQRAVKYKYALEPLSAVGSLVDPAGGRFNVGNIDPPRLPRFSALYFSKAKETALQEALGQEPQPQDGLSALDLALTNPQSIVVVSASGQLDTVIDLRRPDSLELFVQLISSFKIPSSLKRDAVRLSCRYELVVSVEQLLDQLLRPEWRQMPMLYDVPSPSQVFGRLVTQAGVEGIVYPSKLDGEPCVAVFPRSLTDSASFVELDDEAPPGCALRRLDSSNWRQCEQGS